MCLSSVCLQKRIFLVYQKNLTFIYVRREHEQPIKIEQSWSLTFTILNLFIKEKQYKNVLKHCEFNGLNFKQSNSGSRIFGRLFDVTCFYRYFGNIFTLLLYWKKCFKFIYQHFVPRVASNLLFELSLTSWSVKNIVRKFHLLFSFR